MFAKRAAIVAAVLSVIPFLYALTIAKPGGATYIGTQTAVDDTMVYAAWMKQAMDGQFLFDNRFAIEQQPGLTFHAWFLVLGWIAKLIGIPWTLAITRALFSGLAVWASYQLIRRTVVNNYHQKIAVTVATLGAGIGFFVWANLGRVIPEENPLRGITGGHLPIDVWQGEAFAFPSMLINGLFVVSLCLILAIFVCVLDAQYSWKPVLPGALCFLVLMNIHSYDVLLVALVLFGFLGSAAISRTLHWQWALRALAMGAGAVPAALWFLYVLKNDVVFQSRAATPTYAADFRALIVGILPLVLLGMVAIGAEAKDDPARKRMLAGLGGLYGIFLVLFVIAPAHHADTYLMTGGVWAIAFLLTAACGALLATGNPGWNMVTVWAAVGIIAPYFPALFQRKLTMALAVPWAILAAIGFGFILSNRERGMRNLVATFGLLILSATSLRWFTREIDFAKAGYGTVVQNPIYVPEEIMSLIKKADELPGRQVALVHPGIQFKSSTGFVSYVNDYNPYFSGLGGVYTYAGHWSESPNYRDKRSMAFGFFSPQVSDTSREAFLKEHGITLIVAPVQEAYPDLGEIPGTEPLPNLDHLGKVIGGGSQFKLIQVLPK